MRSCRRHHTCTSAAEHASGTHAGKRERKREREEREEARERSKRAREREREREDRERGRERAREKENERERSKRERADLEIASGLHRQRGCSVFIFLGSFDTAYHYSGGTPPHLSSSLISTGIIVSCDCSNFPFLFSSCPPCFHLSIPPFSTKNDFGRTLTAFCGPDGKPCDECHDIVFDRSSPSSTWSSEVEVHLPIYKKNM